MKAQEVIWEKGGVCFCLETDLSKKAFCLDAEMPQRGYIESLFIQWNSKRTEDVCISCIPKGFSKECLLCEEKGKNQNTFFWADPNRMELISGDRIKITATNRKSKGVAKGRLYIKTV